MVSAAAGELSSSPSMRPVGATAAREHIRTSNASIRFAAPLPMILFVEAGALNGLHAEEPIAFGVATTALAGCRLIVTACSDR